MARAEQASLFYGGGERGLWRGRGACNRAVCCCATRRGVVIGALGVTGDYIGTMMYWLRWRDWRLQG